MKCFGFWIFSIVFYNLINDSSGNEYVNINNLGMVRASLNFKTFRSRTQIYHFVDIPYGKLAEKGRFKPAYPADPWNITHDGSVAHRDCPQPANSFRLQNDGLDEECLSITINTKNVAENFPVIVYIHGNDLTDGNNKEADPRFLLEKDVVLAAPNYRVGPFGFLSARSTDIPGNAAISDILLALEWIQLHIADFGGDPTRVTLMGQYGGAAMIHGLTLSKNIQDGYFHQVIYLSGSALTPRFFREEDPVMEASLLAEKAGCSGHISPRDITNCLMPLSTRTILELYAEVRHDSDDGLLTIGSPSGFWRQTPLEIIESNLYKDYPTLGGTDKNVGTKFLAEFYEDLQLYERNHSSPEEIVKKVLLECYIDPDEFDYWLRFAEYACFDPDTFKDGNLSALTPGLIDLVGAINNKSPLYVALQYNNRRLPEKTFLYSFDYKGTHHKYHPPDHKIGFEFGVSYGDETLYLFPFRELDFEYDDDRRISEVLVDLFTSFATTGVPLTRGIYWPPMRKPTGPYLKIDKEITVGHNFVDELTITGYDELRERSLLID